MLVQYRRVIDPLLETPGSDDFLISKSPEHAGDNFEGVVVIALL